MQIRITPEDIIKRGMWDHYCYYVAQVSEKEATELLRKNEEFTLIEKDAIVIGLLKVMETDNLIHRFNDYLIHFLTIRSIKEKTDALIKKKALESSIEKFLEKFPDYWKAPMNYQNSLKDLKVYITELKAKISALEIVNLTVQNIAYEFYSTNSIKKLLNFNNY